MAKAKPYIGVFITGSRADVDSLGDELHKAGVKYKIHEQGTFYRDWVLSVPTVTEKVKRIVRAHKPPESNPGTPSGWIKCKAIKIDKKTGTVKVKR